MSSVSSQTRLLAVIGAGVLLLALLWLAAIAPKRSESAEVRDQVAAQEQRLTVARGQVTSYAGSRDKFPTLHAELRRLNVAVPARGEIADLLRGLQGEARKRGADLRLIALKDPAPAAADAPPVAPGAAPGPSGLATLPFTMEFTGEYFDLLHVLRTARRAVTERSGKLSVKGRLLTIDGLAFKRPERGAPLTKATLNATAYIAPDPDSSPQIPAGAPAAAPTPGGP